ncbi:MAG: hypothetical protein SPE65_09395, partial [Muribaculaceae bacterium]|nr:hypothetical protein [Muribaculaceae bacterium]
MLCDRVSLVRRQSQRRIRFRHHKAVSSRQPAVVPPSAAASSHRKTEKNQYVEQNPSHIKCEVTNFPPFPQPPAENKNDRAKSTAKNGSFFQNESDFIAKTGQNHKNIHYFEKILRKSFVI